MEKAFRFGCSLDLPLMWGQIRSIANHKPMTTLGLTPRGGARMD